MAFDAAVTTAFMARDAGMTATLRKITAQSKKFGSTSTRSFQMASRAARSHNSVMKGILQAGIVVSGLRLIKRGIISLISETSKIEDATAAFTPLMGGVAGAEKLVAELNKTAASTPFQFEQITKATQQLLPVMNKDIGLTISTFRMLGDTAGGNAQKLDSITRGFTKAMLKGKVDMESLNMIAEAGVPIFSEMADSMGVSKAQLFQLSKQGKLSTDDLTKTFRKMTSEGGIFFNGMEIASKTLTGRFSTFKDNVALTAAGIGKAFLPIMKEVVNKGIKVAAAIRVWVAANKEVIAQNAAAFFSTIKTVLKITIPIVVALFKATRFLFKAIAPFANIIPVIVVSMIAYNAALRVQMLLQAGGAISSFIRIIKLMMVMNRVRGTSTALQWALNAAMTANPIGITIVAIAALIAISILLVTHWELVKRKFMEWTAIFDHPVFAAFAAIFAPLITIPIMIARNWNLVVSVLKNTIGLIDKITGFSVIKAAVKKEFGAAPGTQKPKEDEASKDLARSRAQSQALNGNLNVNFANAPRGTTAQAGPGNLVPQPTGLN